MKAALSQSHYPAFSNPVSYTHLEFIKDADATLLDLDLIGKASLYQLISIARTCFGKRAFYDILCGKLPLYQLAGQQAAVSELSNHEFSIQFQKLLINQKIQNGTDCQATKDRLNSFKQYTSYKYLPFLCLMPLLLLLIGLLAAFDKLPGIVFALAFFIQLDVYKRQGMVTHLITFLQGKEKHRLIERCLDE